MSTDPKTLTIEQTFPVAVEALFDAWVNPDVLKYWMAPGAMSVGSVEVEQKEGGCYRVEMKEPGGASVQMNGEVLEIESNQQLTIKWWWSHSEAASNLVVKFSADSDQASSLHIIHGGFSSMDDMQNHKNGWKGCLEKLAKLLSS